jgi:hypothetical protein
MNEKDFTNELKKKYFRIILLGKSQSGKTYFLENRIIKNIREDYDKIIIFTDDMNKNSFKKKFEPCSVISKNHEEVLRKMTDKIKKSYVYNDNNEKLYAKNGDLLRPYNFLFVFDDIFSPKLLKSEIFIELICILRHLQISVVFITQHCEIILNRLIKSQSDMIVLMKTSDQYSRNRFIDIIQTALINDYEDKKRKEKAMKIYNEIVLNNKYGKVIVDLNPYRIKNIITCNFIIKFLFVKIIFNIIKIY